MSGTSVDRWSFVLDEETKILLVDDDLILSEFAKVHLSTPTTTVVSAVNSEEAWERLRQETFDLVLLDIEMPVLDGFDLLKRLRADPRFAQLPVVMLTGREDITSIDRAYQLGANSFVPKPINWRQLSYALRYVLRTTRIEGDLIGERRRSDELLKLTNNLLSLIRVEARTPLSSIIGFCDCIKREIDGPIGVPSYLNYAEQIDAAARRLQDDFMDLIQYAQLTSGAAKLSEDEYPAGKLLDATVSGIAFEERNVDILVGKPSENLYLTCDLMWLTRAMKHLLDAAIGQGGVERIAIDMRQMSDGGVTISIGAEGGLSTGETRKPFLPVAAGHGKGLSVSFARCVVELHQGQLTIREREDGGADMEISLPSQRVLLEPHVNPSKAA